MGLFDTKPSFPRWCYSLADVLTAGKVVDPGSQKQTNGWSDNEKPSFSTFNWLGATTYLALGYLEQTLIDFFDQDFVARGSDCEVTLSGLRDLDIAAGKVWSSGAFYELDADALTPTATIPGNARIDAVVATSSGYELRAGTATTLPTEPTEPTLTAGDVILAYARIEGSVCTLLTDERVHGAFHGDRIRADRFFRAGAQGGGAYNIEVDGAADEVTCQATDWTAACTGTHAVSGDNCTMIGTSAVTVTSSGTVGIQGTTSVQINDLSGGPVSIGHGGTTVDIDGDVTIGGLGDTVTLAGTVECPSGGIDFVGGAVTKTKVIAGHSGISDSATSPYIVGHQFSAAGQHVLYDLDLPDGAELVEVTVHCDSNGTTDTVTATLYRKTTTGETSKASDSGYTTLTLTPASAEAANRSGGTHVVDIEGDAAWAGDIVTIRALTVEYTIDGLRAA